MLHTTTPFEPFNPWSTGRSYHPHWDGPGSDWGMPGHPEGMYFPGGFNGPRGFVPAYHGGHADGTPWGASSRGFDGLGFGGGFGGGFSGGFSRGWPGYAGSSASPGFTTSLSGEDLLRSLAWIPGALREAANDIESSDTTRRLQSEGAARGIFGYLKGTLSAFGVDASIDAGLERRGISVSVSYSRAGLLATADSIENVLGDAQSRGFEAGCRVTFSRSFAGVMRGLSGSCYGSFTF